MRTFINVSVSALVALGMVVPQFALAAGERSGGFLQRFTNSQPQAQGQSQNSKSQQSPQLQSKQLGTQQTNQNSPSQNWTTGSGGQYRIFRLDSTQSQTSASLIGSGIAGGVVGVVGGKPVSGTNPSGPTGPVKPINPVIGTGPVKANPGQIYDPGGSGGQGTGTGGTGTGGTGTGGTGTGGTGTGMPPSGMGGSKIPPWWWYSHGGYPVWDGATYSAYRVDTAVEPALAANAAPGVVVRIMNPAATHTPINFIMNGQVVRLQAGEAGDFRVDGSGVAKFDRGGNFGATSYTLKEGIYRFEPTAQGWELYEETAAAAQPAGLPSNALPGEASK